MYVTRNFVVYNEYGSDIDKASKVIRKYFKEKSLKECKIDLQKCVIAFKAGIQFVDTNKDLFWKSKEKASPELNNIEIKFCGDHPDFSIPLLKSMLSEIFMWYHER